MKLIFFTTVVLVVKAVLYDTPIDQEELTRTLIEKFYSKQGIIKVFTGLCDCDWSNKVIIKTLFGQKNILLYDHNDEENLIFSPNYGYITFANSLNRDILHQLSQFKNNGKWLLILDGTFNKEYLKIAWDEFRILHLVILTVDEDKYTVTFYDPYTVTSMKTRGVFHRYLLTNAASVEMVVDKIDARARNLHGYVLKVYVDKPGRTYMNPVYNQKGKLVRYTGIDGEMLESVRHSMNFVVNFLPPLLSVSIDDITTNITEAIKKKIVDFLPAAGLLNRAQFSEVYPLYPIAKTEIVCGVPKKRSYHTINVLYGFLDIPGTILFYSTTTIFSICIYFSIKKEIREDFLKYMLDIIGVQFNISRYLRKYKRLASRLILMSSFVLNLTIVATYQASIISILSVASKTRQINTLNDLIRENVTVLAIPSFYNQLKPDINDSSSSIHNRLFKQFVYNKNILNEDIFKSFVVNKTCKNVGTLVRKYQALFFKAQYVNNETGQSGIHIVGEPLAVFPQALHLPKWSPFIPVMDEMVIRAFEMGFAQKGYNDADQYIWLTRLKTYKHLNHDVLKPSPLTMENMNFTFILYFSFLGFVFIVFLIEIVVYKISKK